MEKHGEAAYPAEAWVEMQYNSKSDGNALPSNMAGNPGEKVKRNSTLRNPDIYFDILGSKLQQPIRNGSNLWKTLQANEFLWFSTRWPGSQHRQTK